MFFAASRVLIIGALLGFVFLDRVECLSAAESSPRVNIILWFDTEDYLLPADDDATKRLCQMLTERNIRATFKLVGEKARVLERRGRQDVITALRKHDLGYHSDFHSVHPTPTEYLAECGWLDGIAEFARREGSGAADVRRIFQLQTLACYGQPGSSWGPQAIAALREIGVAPQGVPCYVDEGSNVTLDGTPFWYAGALNVFGMNPNLTRMELHQADALEPAKKKAKAIVDRLSAEGGLISIFYHPCEWVHREFWDGVNFSRGANPPREKWKVPPQRTPEETEAAFKRFAEYIDYIRALPGVHWVTASELPGLYPDRMMMEGVPESDLDELARRILNRKAEGLDFQRIDKRTYSVADQFELLSLGLRVAREAREPSFPIKPAGLAGPDSAPPVTSLTSIDGFAFRDAMEGVWRFVDAEHRVPARVFVGSEAVAPADFLIAMAGTWAHRQIEGADEAILLGHDTRIAPERHVAGDTPGLFGGWIIHKEGFRAPKVVQLAKLQAWTLKPATPAEGN